VAGWGVREYASGVGAVGVDARGGGGEGVVKVVDERPCAEEVGKDMLVRHVGAEEG
jgi:hypothetical protein